MTVADLFYNVPARRAFLKTAAAEFAACHEYMQALALSLPTVGFTLLHNDREVFAVSPALKTEGHLRGEASMRARAAALIGAEDTGRLIYVQRPDRHAHVEALISPPGLDKATARHCFTFVNGRWVRDKLLRFALQRGYHSHLMKGKFPIALLYVTIDPALVDVNVHPAKAELRFQYAQEVQNALVHAIREALREGSWASANPPVKTVDSPPAPVAPDDFDLSLPQDSRDDVKRTVMRFDAEPPAPVKARVQPPLKFDAEPAPARSGATSALSKSSPTGAPASRSSGLPSASPRSDKELSSPGSSSAASRSAEGVALRSSGAEGSVLTRSGSAGPQTDLSVGGLQSDSVPSGSSAQAQANTTDIAVSSKSSSPKQTEVSSESSLLAKADPTGPMSSPPQADSSLSSRADLSQAVAQDSGKLLRSVGQDKTINAKPVSAVSALKTASVPSPDGQTTIPWSELQYIGPFARCFLLFEYQQQMLAIDQHAFHERVLYERLVENPDILRRAQPLLMPEVLVFSPTETERLVHMKDALDALGIQIQGVSDTEIEVTAVPSLLVNKDLNSLLAAILGGRDKASELAHDVLATMACHAAVRAGEELPEPELKALLREAESVDFYHNCPHGRRVFRWWKLAQVASWFDR
jgi:DNA mismatch repair protein MutL